MKMQLVIKELASMEICNMICSIVTALATIALAIFAFQARNSYLRQELHSFAWDFLDNYRDLRAWVLCNIDKFDLQKNEYDEDLDKEFWNRLNIVEKIFLKIDIVVSKKFFAKTKMQLKLCHKIWLNYSTQKDKDKFNKQNIQAELLNHVETEEFVEFVDKYKG